MTEQISNEDKDARKEDFDMTLRMMKDVIVWSDYSTEHFSLRDPESAEEERVCGWIRHFTNPKGKNDFHSPQVVECNGFKFYKVKGSIDFSPIEPLPNSKNETGEGQFSVKMFFGEPTMVPHLDGGQRETFPVYAMEIYLDEISFINKSVEVLISKISDPTELFENVTFNNTEKFEEFINKNFLYLIRKNKISNLIK